MMGHGEAPAPGVPLVIIAGLQGNSMPGRAVLVKSACSSPALGRLAHEAVVQRYLNMMLGIVVMSSTLVIVVNVCVDLIHAWLDPRAIDRFPYGFSNGQRPASGSPGRWHWSRTCWSPISHSRPRTCPRRHRC